MQTPSGFGRRNFLQASAGAALATALPASAGAAGDARARKPFIIDTLGSISNPNLGIDDDVLAVDARSLADARAAGLTAFNQTIGYVAGPGDPFEASVKAVGEWDALIRKNPKDLLKVFTAADLHAAHASGRVGVILGFQNAVMMGQDPKRVELFSNLGVRVIQLTYNVHNPLGDGATVKEDHGLTPFGREVVAELNRSRVLVDLSHSGEQTCLDAISASSTPIAITHTGCRAVADLPRNKSDQELRLLAEKGGVAGIYFMPFLAIDRQPMARDLIAHVEHALNVCGEDHVSIGTDGALPRVDDLPKFYEALKKEVEARKAAGIGAPGERADIVTFLPDLQGPDKFWRLAGLLQARGHKARVIDKVLGGNFLRLAATVWGNAGEKTVSKL